jgi:hypothetical protein
MKWADRSLVLTLAIENLDHVRRFFARCFGKRQTPCRSDAVLDPLRRFHCFDHLMQKTPLKMYTHGQVVPAFASLLHVHFHLGDKSCCHAIVTIHVAIQRQTQRSCADIYPRFFQYLTSPEVGVSYDANMDRYSDRGTLSSSSSIRAFVALVGILVLCC